MPYSRGDIIELPFLIPGKNKLENHPAIIISNQAVHDIEGIYICVMVTHSGLHEEFGFKLADDMFANPKKAPEGYAKGHLIAYILENHIIRNSHRGKTKSTYVDELVDFITDNVLLE
jgi:hypothetical protein